LRKRKNLSQVTEFDRLPNHRHDRPKTGLVSLIPWSKAEKTKKAEKAGVVACCGVGGGTGKSVSECRNIPEK